MNRPTPKLSEILCGQPIQPLNPEFKAEVRATPREIRMGRWIIAVFALGVLLWAVFEGGPI